MTAAQGRAGPATAPHRDLVAEYREALAGYMLAPDEIGRARAYELGHRAVEEEMGLLDLVAVHRLAAADAAADAPTRERVVAAMDFLTESLATFEMAQRGYREAQERAALAHDLALTLQRSLLPPDLPELEGVELAVRYLPAGPHVDVGGDWYDVVTVGPDRAGLVVGDVMGHGLRQAAVMGQMRMGLRAYLLEGHPIDDVVRRTDALLQSLGGLQTATLVVCELDLARRTFRLANAGHPPPILLEPGCAARLVLGGHGRLLGLSEAADRPVLGPVALPVGSCLLMYTDGLLELDERAGEDGLDHLRAIVDGFDASPGELCDRVTEAMVADDPGDDVCLLAAKLVAAPGVG